MRLAFVAFLAPLALSAQTLPPAATPSQPRPDADNPLLARVAEEADVMWQNIPKTLTIETLEQRSVLPPPRFRPRVGTAAAAPAVRSTVRQIVSEYSVGTLRDADSGDLHEFRQVISVDGQPVQTEESARRALSLGLQSPTDRTRKRMLEQLTQHGLVDIAIDYGLILLEFTRRGWQNLQFGSSTRARLGTDTAVVRAWKQLSTAGGELEFHGRRAVRQSLQGRLWMRKSDGLPLRVEAWAEVVDAGCTVRDQASVDYVMSSHGFLTPVSVVHRHLVDGRVMTENLYRYAPFKMFSAEADIKFTEAPESPPTPAKP
jgi:hypothetical protein